MKHLDPMVNQLALADDDLDDPIVWQCGKWLPDGRGGMRCRLRIMRRSDEVRLVSALGREWLDQYCAEMEADIAKWGMN